MTEVSLWFTSTMQPFVFHCLLHADAEFSTAFNVMSAETKAVLFEIGTGRCLPADWLLPLYSKSAASKNDPVDIRNDDDSSDTVEYNPTEPEFASTRHAIEEVQGAANKSNPLPCFVNISTTNLNFYKKIYVPISHSYLHIIAKLCCIITTFD